MSDSRELLKEEEIQFLLQEKQFVDAIEAPEQLPGDGEITMRGDLDKMQLADVFQTLAMSKMEGQLRVRNLVENHELFFGDGYVRSIPPQRTEIKRIGQRLLQAGLLTIEQLRSALLYQKKNRDRQLGQILVDEGYVTEQDIQDVFDNQIQEDLFALFTWKHGSFEFYKGPCRDPDVIARLEQTPRFEVNGLLLEVARRGDEWQRVLDAIGDLDEILEVVPGVEPEEPFEADYETVMNAVDGMRTVRALADHTALGLFTCGCIVRDLAQAGFLRRIDVETALSVAEQQCDNGDLKLATMTFHLVRRRADAFPVDVAVPLAKGLQRCGENRWAARVLVAAARAERDPIEALKVARIARKCAGRSPEVLRFLKQMLKESGADPQELHDVTADLAEVLADEGDGEEALEALRDLEELGPKSLQSLNRKAKILARIGCKEEAIETLLELAQMFRDSGEKERLCATYEQILKLDYRRKDVAKALKALKSGATRHARLALIAMSMLAVAGYGYFELRANQDRAHLEGIRDDAMAAIADGDFTRARKLVDSTRASHPDTRVFDDVLTKIAEHVKEQRAQQRAEIDERYALALGNADRAIATGDLAKAFEIYANLAALGKQQQEIDKVVKTRLESIRDRLDTLKVELDAKLPPRPNLLQTHEERQRLIEDARRHFLDADLRVARAILDEDNANTIVLHLNSATIEALTSAASEVERLFVRCHEIVSEHERELERTMIAQRLTPLYDSARRYEDAYDFDKALDAYRRLAHEHPEEDELKASFRDRVERYATIKRFMQVLGEATRRGDFATAQGKLRALQQAYADIPFANLVQLPVRIETQPAGATVFVDGRKVGTAPLTAAYTPGRTTEIRIELGGFLDEQTRFRGDEVSTVRSLLAKSPTWVLETGVASDFEPVVDGAGRGFLVDRSGNITAFDARTGERTWAYQTGDLSGLLPRPTLVGEDAVVVGSIDGTLRCFERASGDLRWSIPDMPCEVSQATLEGAVFVVTTDQRLVAIEISSGAVRFSRAHENNVGAPPIALDEVVVTVSERGEVVAFDPVEGKTRWKQSIGHRVYLEPCAHGRFLAIAGDEGVITVLDSESGFTRWSRDGLGLIELEPSTDGRWLYVAADRTVHRCLLASGRDATQYTAGRRLTAPPTPFGHLLLAGREDGVIEVVDEQSGQPRFLLRDDARPTAPPIVTRDGTVVAGFADGSVHGYRLGDRNRDGR